MGDACWPTDSRSGFLMLAGPCACPDAGGLELDAGCLSPADERAGPGQDHVLFLGFCADQQGQGVGVAHGQFAGDAPGSCGEREGRRTVPAVACAGRIVSSPIADSSKFFSS